MIPSASPAFRPFRLLTYTLLVSALALSLAACGTQEPGLNETDEGAFVLGRVAVQAQESRTVAPADRTVRVEGLRGALRIRGHADETAAWTFTKIARDRDSTRAGNVLRGIRIAEEGTEAQYTFTLQSDVPNQSTVDITGTLPVQAPLTVQRSSGVVEGEGVRGAVDIEQTHGTVHLRNMGGSVRARLDNGDIRVDWADLPASASVDLETQNGTIHLTVPPESAAQLDVATTAGRIFSQGLAYTNRELRASEAGYEFVGQLGTGAGASIRARTTHGNIVLAVRADTAGTLPAAPATPDPAGADAPSEAAPDTTASDAPNDAPPVDMAAPDTLIEAPAAPPADTTAPATDPTAAPASDTTRAPSDTTGR